MSNLRLKHDLRSHADAVEFVGGRQTKVLGHNTLCEVSGDGSIIRYHSNLIAEFSGRGRDSVLGGKVFTWNSVLSSAGWNTVTTARRLHMLMPRHMVGRFGVGITRGVMVLRDFETGREHEFKHLYIGENEVVVRDDCDSVERISL